MAFHLTHSVVVQAPPDQAFALLASPGSEESVVRLSPCAGNFRHTGADADGYTTFEFEERSSLLCGLVPVTARLRARQRADASALRMEYLSTANGGMVTITKVRTFEALDDAQGSGGSGSRLGSSAASSTRVSEQITGLCRPAWLRGFVAGQAARAHREHMGRMPALVASRGLPAS